MIHQVDCCVSICLRRRLIVVFSVDVIGMEMEVSVVSKYRLWTVTSYSLYSHPPEHRSFITHETE